MSLRLCDLFVYLASFVFNVVAILTTEHTEKIQSTQSFLNIFIIFVFFARFVVGKQVNIRIQILKSY